MDSATTTHQKRSRRYLRRGGITVGVLILLGLLLLYAPRYLARYVLASQLDALQIDHSGIDTLIINPFTRELWLGPVRIGDGTSAAAQLETLGLTLGYNQLLHKHIFIEKLTVQGIDVAVTRDQDNRFILNGIPFDRMMPPSADEAVQPAPEGKPWQPGIDAFELRDSRLIFHDKTGGELVVDVERLSLMGFLGWEPQRPGRFELTALANDIELNWSGEARPFADDITLSIDSRTRQADLPKIIRFTGALGLDRSDGSYDAQLKHELTLFQAGGFKGSTQGMIEVSAADYQRKDAFGLRLDQAKSDLDVQYALGEKGDFSLQGKLILDLGSTRANLANQTEVSVESGRIVLDSLDTSYTDNGRLQVSTRPELDLRQLAFAGPIEFSVDRLLNVLALLQSLSAGSEVTTADTGLGDFAGGSVAVPDSKIEVGRVQSRGDSLSLLTDEGELDFALSTRSELFDIRIGVDEGSINVKQLKSDLDQLHVVSGQGRLAVDMVGGNALSSGMVNATDGEMQLDSLVNRLSEFALRVETGAITLQVSGENEASGFSGLIYARETLPEVDLQVGQANTRIDQAAVDVQGETVKWQVAGNAGADALKLGFAKGEESQMKFERAAIQGLQADEGLLIAADAVSVDGLALLLKRSLLEGLLKGDAGEAQQAGAAVVPGGESADDTTNDLARAQALLTELGYDPGAADGRMGQNTAAAIKAFQEKEGLNADGRMSNGLLAQLALRAAGAAPGADSDAPGLQVGQLRLNGRPVIRFHDDIVDPAVEIATVFETFEVQHLSTRAQQQRTDIRVAALINEFTNLDVTGWARGLNPTADMDMNVQVKNLELVTYSPYVAELAGMYLDSGQLNTQIAGKASGGILQGQLQVDIDDLAFEPLSEEDAARMSDIIGVPLGLAVSLLEDGKGHIGLKLPVSGTLSKPDVDISSAVNKAIGGALKRVFPPTLAAGLLSKLAEGGGASFEPIVFAAGSSELDETGRGYADKVAEFLKERPKLSLKVCGRVTSQDLAQLTASAASAAERPETTVQETPQDRPEQQADEASEEASRGHEAAPTQDQPQPAPPAQKQPSETLNALALERTRVVRAYLIEEKQIDAKRVSECRSKFDADDQGKPRVEILF